MSPPPGPCCCEGRLASRLGHSRGHSTQTRTAIFMGRGQPSKPGAEGERGAVEGGQRGRARGSRVKREPAPEAGAQRPNL